VTYNTDGQLTTTVVTGSSYTGLYAADGSYNIVLNTSPTYIGLWHSCGGLNAFVVNTPDIGYYAPNGSVNVITKNAGYVLAQPQGNRSWTYTYNNPEAAAVAAAFTIPPSFSRASQIDTLVGSLKSAGVWSLIDVLYVMAAADSQAAGINWINPATFVLIPTGSPAFTANKGYTGNGATSYLDSGYNPSTAALGMTLNDGHISGWSLSNLPAASNNRIVGNTGTTSGRTLILLRNIGDFCSPLVNDAGGSTITNTTTQGHFIANRSGLSALQVYRNGSSIGSLTTASASLATFSVSFLRDDTFFSTLQISCGSMGRSLTAPQSAAFYSALQVYMQSVGAV